MLYRLLAFRLSFLHLYHRPALLSLFCTSRNVSSSSPVLPTATRAATRPESTVHADLKKNLNTCVINTGSHFSSTCVFFCSFVLFYASFFFVCHLSNSTFVYSGSFFCSFPHDVEPAASSIPPRGFVSSLLLERPARRDAEFVELVGAFLARENPVLELESPLTKPFSSKTNLCSQHSALHPDLDTVRSDLTAIQSSVVTATSKHDQLLAKNRRFTLQSLDLTLTADSLRLQLTILQASISPDALDSPRSERDCYLGHLRYSAGQI